MVPMMTTLPMLVAMLLGSTTTPATCAFDVAAPEPCTIDIRVDAEGITHFEAVGRGGHRIRFTGRRADGWWSGALDDAPAMGYERNRGNVVFATRALDRSFQYWTAGNAHGRY